MLKKNFIFLKKYFNLVNFPLFEFVILFYRFLARLKLKLWFSPVSWFWFFIRLFAFLVKSDYYLFFIILILFKLWQEYLIFSISWLLFIISFKFLKLILSIYWRRIKNFYNQNINN